MNDKEKELIELIKILCKAEWDYDNQDECIWCVGHMSDGFMTEVLVGHSWDCPRRRAGELIGEIIPPPKQRRRIWLDEPMLGLCPENHSHSDKKYSVLSEEMHILECECLVCGATWTSKQAFILSPLEEISR